MHRMLTQDAQSTGLVLPSAAHPWLSLTSERTGGTLLGHFSLNMCFTCSAFGLVLLPLNFSLLQDWQLQESPVLWESTWTSFTAFTTSTSVPWAFPISPYKPSASLSLFQCNEGFLLLLLPWSLHRRFLMRKSRVESGAVQVGTIRARSTSNHEHWGTSWAAFHKKLLWTSTLTFILISLGPF